MTYYARRKTLLNRSGVEWTDYNCNHYIGCAHGCTYPCYARKIKRMKYEEWIRPGVVKNALELAVREIRGVRPGSRIMVSSMCDPYQPIEEIEKLTRSLIPVLASHYRGYEPHTVILITKSDLVRRDFELIEQFPNVKLCMTITSIEDLPNFEPFSSGNRARIACLHDAKAKGIYTIASIEPWIPNRTKIILLLQELMPYVDEVFIGSWNHKFKHGSENYRAIVQHYRSWLPEAVTFLENHMKKFLIKEELRRIFIKTLPHARCVVKLGSANDVKRTDGT